VNLATGAIKARRKKDTYLTLCDGDGGGPMDGAACASPLPVALLVDANFFGFVMGDTSLEGSSLQETTKSMRVKILVDKTQVIVDS
jgi:hypothetical protein